MTDLDLQDEVQRYTGLFIGRLAQAFEPLARSPSPKVREFALRRHTLYLSSIIDIACAPTPAVNVLDLLAMVKLCAQALDREWIPKLLGAEGKELVTAFDKAEDELQPLLRQVLSHAEQRDLERFIDEWLDDNTDLTMVEAVRLSSEASGMSRRLEQSGSARGVLARMKSARQAADHALLLSERAVFLSVRLPFLVRLHARLLVHELVADGVSSLRRLVTPRSVSGGLAVLGLFAGAGYLAARRLD